MSPARPAVSDAGVHSFTGLVDTHVGGGQAPVPPQQGASPLRPVRVSHPGEVTTGEAPTPSC